MLITKINYLMEVRIIKVRLSHLISSKLTTNLLIRTYTMTISKPERYKLTTIMAAIKENSP
jgi:hypothetical protein